MPDFFPPPRGVLSDGGHDHVPRGASRRHSDALLRPLSPVHKAEAPRPAPAWPEARPPSGKRRQSHQHQGALALRRTVGKAVWYAAPAAACIPALTLSELSGRITYLHVVGQGLVFLNTPEAVFELMDRRGAIYSDKPNLIMVGELCVRTIPLLSTISSRPIRCGCKNIVAFTPYGDQARRQRRLMQAAFGSSSIKRYQPLLELETKPFLRGLLEDPLKFQDHLRRSGFFSCLEFFFH